ncbi:MAG: hypothetical protein AAF402_03145 [Pseudomonadota bacterium]
MSTNDKKSVSREELDRTTSRRKAISKLLAASGAIGITQTLDKEWVKPTVRSVVMPAHAATTDTGGGPGGGTTQPPPTPSPMVSQTPMMSPSPSAPLVSMSTSPSPSPTAPP